MKIHISFQLQDVPPPYTYAATLKINLSEQINASYQREYLGRDELTQDEIESEGFSEDDDITWEGQLDEAWRTDIRWLSSCQIKQSAGDSLYLYLDRPTDSGFPTDIAQAGFLFESLQQAILEAAEIEAPLSIKIRNNQTINLSWKFATRTFLINQKQMDWHSGIDLLNNIFSREYEELATKKDAAILFDTNWFKLDKSLAKTLTSLSK